MTEAHVYEQLAQGRYLIAARPGVELATSRVASQRLNQLECGQMPNVMAALPNIGGALCSTPQSLADAQYWKAVR